MRVNSLLTAYLVILLNGTVFAQMPSFSTPQPGAFPRYDVNSRSMPRPSGTVNSLPSNTSIQYQQQMEMHRQDVMEVERRNEAIREQNEAFDPYMRKMIADDLTANGFPSHIGDPGTELFQSALTELNDMLTDKTPIDLCRAVYLVENAFYGGSEKYEEFQNQIDERVQLCRWRLKQLKLNPKDNLSLNMMIYSVMCDTLDIKQPGTERTITHYPVNYNLDDYDSQQSFTSHFVTTLMKSNLGQCHSMPLLYMMIAEKLGAEAYLSYAPHHSFIKIQDDKGAWYNLELTCRHILSDQHYMNHSYIKSEAIRNKIYLNPLTKKELIASMTAQLGAYYLVKYGYDPFVMECADISGEHYPDCTQALLLKSNYQTRLTLEIARLLEARNPNILKEKSPEAYRHFEKMHELYQQLDNTGYEDTPTEVYERWHNHVLTEREKEKNNLPSKMRKHIQ